MRASTVVLCRALIMLACLVAIPLAAMFGSSLPQIARQVLDGRWPAFSEAVSSAASAWPGQTPPPVAAAPAESCPIPAAHGPTEPSGSGVIPAAYEAPVPAEGPTPVGFAAEAIPPMAGQADQFAQIQQRLRELGATYYLLESWGSQRQLYRFYCRMAIAGNPDYTRYFEAVESDSMLAMSRVLEQVEAWRAGRQ